MNSHSSLVREAESSEPTSSVGNPSGMSSSTTTASKSSPQESVTDTSQKPRSLETSVSSWSPVKLESTEDLRMWLRRGSPASPSAKRERDKEQKTSATCGRKPQQSSLQYDPKESSLRTRLESKVTCQWCAMTSEEWVTAYLAAPLLPPPAWAQDISVAESGYLPTPTAQSYGNNRGGSAGRVGKVRPSLSALLGGPANPDWLEWLAGFPIGWTALAPLETAKFQQWQQAHGYFSRD